MSLTNINIDGSVCKDANPVNYNSDQPCKICAWIQYWHKPQVCNQKLIAFKSHSTR